MKRSTLLFVLILSLFFVFNTGCSSKDDDEGGDLEFRTGTTGPGGLASLVLGDQTVNIETEDEQGNPVEGVGLMGSLTGNYVGVIANHEDYYPDIQFSIVEPGRTEINITFVLIAVGYAVYDIGQVPYIDDFIGEDYTGSNQFHGQICKGINMHIADPRANR